MTAETTAGRVPDNGPGVEKTLMPTVSFVPTNLCQPSARFVPREKMMKPRLKRSSTAAVSALNAVKRFSLWTMVTCVAELVPWSGKNSAAGAGKSPPSSAANTI